MGDETIQVYGLILNDRGKMVIISEAAEVMTKTARLSNTGRVRQAYGWRCVVRLDEIARTADEAKSKAERTQQSAIVQAERMLQLAHERMGLIRGAVEV